MKRVYMDLMPAESGELVAISMMIWRHVNSRFYIPVAKPQINQHNNCLYSAADTSIFRYGKLK
ncbi:hypothetical protein DU002_10590 [Corallincola holothuriorum]|uniref:Uncharacterized protein n=1 Tax=Corallincola holothuriorum TaxID=2282215 RepID=A0A368NJJ6_9GAMM|nr:hypothetical protein DU002_10590 [Corallincola holothuriorum]